MTLLAICTIIFFLVYGLSRFVPFKYADTITGIAALLVGVIYLIQAV